jgi:hypothetical protein
VTRDSFVTLNLPLADVDLIVTTLRLSRDRYEMSDLKALADRCDGLRGQIQFAVAENVRVANQL